MTILKSSFSVIIMSHVVMMNLDLHLSWDDVKHITLMILDLLILF